MVETRPDFGILLALAYRCYVDELLARLAARGFHGLRPAYGYLFRALQQEGASVTSLARELQISKQAASKIIDDLEARGFITRVSDAADRRIRTVALTEPARQVIAAAQEIGDEIEHEIAAGAGAEQAAAMRSALTQFVLDHGGLDDAIARRARPVW